jgi:hypothetical protein
MAESENLNICSGSGLSGKLPWVGQGEDSTKQHDFYQASARKTVGINITEIFQVVDCL